VFEIYEDLLFFDCSYLLSNFPIFHQPSFDPSLHFSNSETQSFFQTMEQKSSPLTAPAHSVSVKCCKHVSHFNVSFEISLQTSVDWPQELFYEAPYVCANNRTVGWQLYPFSKPLLPPSSSSTSSTSTSNSTIVVANQDAASVFDCFTLFFTHKG